MHDRNLSFWKGAARMYPKYFDNNSANVLEVGSLNVNGSIRQVFGSFESYIGVDWRKGPNVDKVCLASHMSFDKRFSTVVSASMLEHDPEWQLSIVNMVSQVKDDGIIVLSWGAALNSPHCHETAYDGVFHPLPAGKVISLLKHLGVTTTFFRYEGRLKHANRKKPVTENKYAMGEVCLIGFKGVEFSNGEPALDALLPQDAKDWRE